MSETEAASEAAAAPAAGGTPAAPRRPRLAWLGTIVAVVFAALYAYSLWDAIRSLLELPAYYAATGIAAASVPWLLLWIGVAVPPLVFALALLIGRRLNAGSKALVFVTGWAVVQCFTLAIIALEGILRP